MHWTVPNILTVLRLGAALALGLVFFALPRPLADWVAFALFIAAALTDFLDGWLARRLDQRSALGTMLDPIADKAIVIIALITLSAINGLSWVVFAPSVLIVFREVLVSGLREFLGDVKLAVTRLAKWKTTIQMVAIAGLFLAGIWEWYALDLYHAIGPSVEQDILDGTIEDSIGLQAIYAQSNVLSLISMILIWLAALMTLLTGADYFRKAMPHLEEKG